MADHVTALSRASFPATPTQARAVIANYGISQDARARIREQPRLDYCNSLLYGVSDELPQKPQVVENAASRVQGSLITSLQFSTNSTPPIHRVQVSDDV